MLPIAGAGDIESIAWGLILGGNAGWSPQDMSGVGFINISPGGSHYSYTHLDITGSGLLVSLVGDEFAVQIDGGPIYRLTGWSEQNHLVMVPFSSSLKVTSSAPLTGMEAAFALVGRPEDPWTECAFACSLPIVTSDEAYTVLDITGEGILWDLNRKSGIGRTCILVDGTRYLAASYNYGWIFAIPFRSQLRLTVPDSQPTAQRGVYTLR